MSVFAVGPRARRRTLCTLGAGMLATAPAFGHAQRRAA